MNSLTPIAARIDSQISLRMSDVPERMRWSITQRFTVKNPELKKRENLGLNTRHIQHMVPFYRVGRGPMGDELTVPRGAFLKVSAMAARAGCRIDLDGRNKVVTRSATKVPIEDLGVELRDYQVEAVGRLLDRVQGFVSLPCGSGKTVLGGAAIAMSGEPSIVLVHTEDLAMQWADVLTNMYDLDVRMVGAGGGDIRWMPLKGTEVAVAMVQTLHSNPHKRDTLLSSAGAVIMDECHHAPADSFRNLFRLLPARYRWGLTATPERPDGWGLLLSMFIGPELFSMTPSQLVDGGYLSMPRIIPVSPGVAVPSSMWSSKKGSHAIASRAMNWLCENNDRTNLIADIAMEGVEAERVGMVLVPRVRFARKLADILKQRGADAVAVTGRMNKRSRERALQDLRDGRIQVVVATQLADEGLDVPTLDFLVNASAGRAAGRAIQRVGRAMRIAPGKRAPLVVEIVDRGGVFERQWQARAMAYESKLNVDIPGTADSCDALEAVQTALRQTGDSRESR
jgi:superfamily II DNA or RNA helicase